VHGDLGQGAREQALRAFRSGKVDVLVATDVAARGIDVTDVTHVINYQCPEDAKTYVHRIGRTGRAGKEGVAVTLVDWDELHRWKTISDDLGLGMPEAPETYSTSEHLFTDLAIPTSSKGRLPHSQRTRAGLDAEYVDTEGDQGGRKRTDRSGRGDRKRESEPVIEPRRPRRDRTRTRSRSGVTVGGSDDAGTGSDTGTGGDVVTAAPDTRTDSDGAPQGATDGTRTDGDKPKRRRRRGGAGRRGAGGEGGDRGDQQTPDAAAS
jgi:superfamily II DNA/RNA helicase